MNAFSYVAKNDRYTTVIERAKEMIAGEMPINQSVDMIDEIIELKNYFASYYGETSKEFAVARAILNVSRMISRSIRIQKEPANQTVSDWVEKYPQRMAYIKRIEDLISQ